MSEELDRLWALRGLDEEIGILTRALARFPEQRASLEQRLAGERQRLETLKTRLHDLQLERRKLEKDAEALAEQERKFQNQLLSVKKNEEYTALLHEIAATKARRSDLETEVLLRLEEEEKIHGGRPALERSLQQIERETADRASALATEEGQERARLAALAAQRATQLEGLPPAVRTRYERIHGSRGGQAVVAILKGACGGCFRTQPPQVLQEARRRDRLLACDGCGRLLLWPPEGA